MSVLVAGVACGETGEGVHESEAMLVIATLERHKRRSDGESKVVIDFTHFGASIQTRVV